MGQKKIKNYAIILASGTGSRFGGEQPKQFVKITDKTILEHSVSAFEQSSKIDAIIVVITPGYEKIAKDLLKNYKKVVKILTGGEIRKESSYIGINSVDETEANVLIHDCARPLVSQRIISECVDALEKYDAVDTAIPSSDTILEVENNIIQDIPNRAKLMRSQTPQCFKLSVIKKAHELSRKDTNFTDDCGLVVKYGLCPVYIVKGDENNIKITFHSDINFCKNIL